MSLAQETQGFYMRMLTKNVVPWAPAPDVTGHVSTEPSRLRPPTPDIYNPDECEGFTYATCYAPLNESDMLLPPHPVRDGAYGVTEARVLYSYCI